MGNRSSRAGTANEQSSYRYGDKIGKKGLGTGRQKIPRSRKKSIKTGLSASQGDSESGK